MAIDLVEGAGVPLSDAGVRGEPVLLRNVNLVDRATSVTCDSLRTSAVVGSVAEHLGEFPSVLEGSAMVAVVRVGLYQLVEGRRGLLG